MRFALQLGEDWRLVKEQPGEGVGLVATHRKSLARCSLTLAALNGRSMQELLDSAKLNQAGGFIQETVVDGHLGSAPAKIKRLTNSKEGTHYKGTLEFRFASQRDKLAAAYCVFTPLPTGFRPDGAAAGKKAPDLNAGSKAIAEFFASVTLPAN